MYFAAQAALLDAGIEANTHRGVITMFGRHLVEEGPLASNLGRLLSNTMQKRQVSDYDPQPGTTEAEALDVLEGARGFVDRIKGLVSR